VTRFSASLYNILEGLKQSPKNAKSILCSCTRIGQQWILPLAVPTPS